MEGVATASALKLVVFVGFLASLIAAIVYATLALENADDSFASLDYLRLMLETDGLNKSGLSYRRYFLYSLLVLVALAVVAFVLKDVAGIE